MKEGEVWRQRNTVKMTGNAVVVAENGEDIWYYISNIRRQQYNSGDTWWPSSA
jgi:hypothetical protein